MTRRKLFTPMLCCMAMAVQSAMGGVIITGAVDGPLSGGIPKAIEFFVDADGTDLSQYGFGGANNGGGTDGVEYIFSGTANAGDFFYLASEDLGAGNGGFEDFFGFAPTFDDGIDTGTGNTFSASINGDDALELFFDATGTFAGGETVVDVFGDINVDGTSQPWEYLDGWAYRNDNTGPDGSTFVLANWSFSGPNALDGETSNGTAATPFPIGTYVVPEPTSLVLMFAGLLGFAVRRRS